MLEQALHLLSLHLMWKSQPFLHPRDTPLSQDEAQNRETMINQRDALVEKLVEYAVGTQVRGNGIVESVKRAVCILTHPVLWSFIQGSYIGFPGPTGHTYNVLISSNMR